MTSQSQWKCPESNYCSKIGVLPCSEDLLDSSGELKNVVKLAILVAHVVEHVAGCEMCWGCLNENELGEI